MVNDMGHCRSRFIPQSTQKIIFLFTMFFEISALAILAIIGYHAFKYRHESKYKESVVIIFTYLIVLAIEMLLIIIYEVQINLV